MAKAISHPGLAMPVMLGVLTGSLFGAHHLMGARTQALTLIFAAVVGVLALEMMYSGFSGGMR